MTLCLGQVIIYELPGDEEEDNMLYRKRETISRAMDCNLLVVTSQVHSASRSGSPQRSCQPVCAGGIRSSSGGGTSRPGRLAAAAEPCSASRLGLRGVPRENMFAVF